MVHGKQTGKQSYSFAFSLSSFLSFSIIFAKYLYYNPGCFMIIAREHGKKSASLVSITMNFVWHRCVVFIL